jgi:hypothetical protein
MLEYGSVTVTEKAKAGIVCCYKLPSVKTTSEENVAYTLGV